MSKSGKFDFSGYATKNGLKCSDGRVILRDAFKHQDGTKVPLVWQHLHGDVSNVLGHAILENRADGVYCYGKFNDSKAGQDAKLAVEHGDIDSLSIYANQLQEQAKQVKHGSIREVSLVLSGANPGALIENVSLNHGDGTYEDDLTAAVIYSGTSLDNDLQHAADDAEGDERTIEEVYETFDEDQKLVVHAMIAHAIGESGQNDSVAHADKLTDDSTVEEVFNTFTEVQKKVVYFMIGAALEEAAGDAKHSDLNVGGEGSMKHNVFDKSTEGANTATLTHDQLTSIVAGAKKYGSLRESFLAHAVDYGFNPVDVLFPDARDVNPDGPEVIKRDDSWVADVLASTNHTPFSRIRTRVADLTAEDARAKGYVTGSLKKDEVITLLKRVTTPTTIYKKQKLDRDDIIDITDFDVVVWLKKEMRLMLNEEIARAVLLGDGRSAADEDKIDPLNIRPIALDDGNVFVHRVAIDLDATTDEIIDEFVKARKAYKGSGVPALYVSTELLTDMLLLKDTLGHRLYKTDTELASVLRVSRIVEVEPMNTAVRVDGVHSYPILGIVANLKDYTIGADKGGQVAMFDDFDIDYNQQKYLIETRMSGALTKPKSALVLERKDA